MATTPESRHPPHDKSHAQMKTCSRITLRFGHRLVSLWIMSLLLSLPGNGTVVPHLDVAALAERADLIVVGRVTNRERGRRITLPASEGNTLGWNMRGFLQVDKTIKGSVQGSVVTFTFILPDEGIGYTSIGVGRYGVFFLRQADDGHEVLDPYHAYVPAVPGALTQTGSALEKVTRELANVVASPSRTPPDRWTRWDAVRALETILSPSASATLRTAVDDKDPLVGVWAMSALLNRNDLSVLDGVEKLGPIPSDPHVENLTAHLGFAIERVKDKRAIPQLSRLLRNGDVNIRRGAASALRNTQDSRAIKPLTEALYDSDGEVQYQAVIGLAEITGTTGEWAPASDTFLKNPQRYLDHWRDWAKANK